MLYFEFVLISGLHAVDFQLMNFLHFVNLHLKPRDDNHQLLSAKYLSTLVFSLSASILKVGTTNSSGSIRFRLDVGLSSS